MPVIVGPSAQPSTSQTGPDLVIKRGDTKPTLGWTVYDPAGDPVDLTGATIRFVMRNMQSTGPTTNTTTAATIVSAVAGTVQYTFTATDTAIAGSYAAEFHITFADATTYTSPNDSYIEVQVQEDMIAATSARLVSLFEIRDHLRLTTNDQSRDARLIRLLDGLTPVVEEITGPVLPRSYYETFDGGQAWIVARHRPILSVQSVVEYVGTQSYVLTQVATPDAGGTYTYSFEPGGRIIRRSAGGGTQAFPCGLGTVAVTYTAGYATVPANVREAALELIRTNFARTELGYRPNGFAVGSGGDDDGTPAGPALGFLVPGRVRQLLAPSRRAPSIA